MDIRAKILERLKCLFIWKMHAKKKTFVITKFIVKAICPKDHPINLKNWLIWRRLLAVIVIFVFVFFFSFRFFFSLLTILSASNAVPDKSWQRTSFYSLVGLQCLSRLQSMFIWLFMPYLYAISSQVERLKVSAIKSKLVLQRKEQSATWIY